MRLLASFLLFLAFAGAEDPPRPEQGKEGEDKKKPVAVAVIVHPKNPVTKITFSELRTYLKMDRQFWPNRKRCIIYLPPRKTVENEILLKKVYRMSHKKLQQYWVRKLFSGEIPAKPTYVPSAKAAISRVLLEEGAISVIPLDKVTKQVRVLLIDDKKPGEEGYPLVLATEP